MSSSTKTLLIELRVEELPPKALKRLGEVFAETIEQSLRGAGLVADHALATSYATPRRLAVKLTQVRVQAAARDIEHKLMPVSVGLTDAGEATPALLKKLQAVGGEGVALSSLERRGEGKAQTLVWRTQASGVTLTQGVQDALNAALTALPIPKVMSYQLSDGWQSVSFVRPAHGLVVLHGSDLINVGVLGLTSGRETLGHRFEANVDPIVLQTADQYAEQLEMQGAVVASFASRRTLIVRQLQHAAAALNLKPIEDEALVDEVTSLVERPNVLTCEFDPAFLDVPSECLILTMKANQKYFPLLDAQGKLTNKFLVVSNIQPVDASAIIEGNQRVVRPRLADAKFFFDQDRKKTLESRAAALDRVVYHGKLGSQGARSERVRAITHVIVKQLRDAMTPYTAQTHDEMEMLAHKADQAARLAKCDLLTDMVGEFPELQGVMGGYYARHEGLRDGVAIAIEDHYKPRFAGDALPRNHTGIVLALADKLETLVGLFGIGQLPTGDKDPYALRRHALGVIRLLTEKHLALDLPQLVRDVVPVFGGLIQDPSEPLLSFFNDRLAVSLREQGFTAQEVDAVLSLGAARLDQVPKRLEAVRAFGKLAESGSLAAANKRVANILKKSEAPVAGAVDLTLLQEAAERELHAALAAVVPKADARYAEGHYADALRELAVLKGPVDAFFDGVMVNADDAALRRNRLALLSTLHGAMNRVADLSKLAV